MLHTAPKLHKVGEYGHGKSVLTISSANTFKDGLHSQLINKFSKEPKVFLYSFDLNNFDENEFLHQLESLTNTFNKYHFARIIIIDFLVFSFLISHLHKIDLSHKGFEHLVIFNPITYTTKKFKTLFDQEIKVQNLQKLLKESHERIFEIKSEKIDIVGLQDLAESLKFSSKLKNSRLHKTKSYDEGLEKIIEIIAC